MKKVLALACLGTLLLASSVFGAAKPIPFYQVGGGETFFVAVTNVSTSSVSYTIDLFNAAGTKIFSTSPTIAANAVTLWDSGDNLVPNTGGITAWPDGANFGTGTVTSATANSIVAWGVVYAGTPQTGFTVTVNGGNAF